jgi:hypothetical protein
MVVPQIRMCCDEGFFDPANKDAMVTPDQALTESLGLPVTSLVWAKFVVARFTVH